VSFQWHLKPHHGGEVGVTVGFTLLLEGNTTSTGKKMAIKKKLLVKKNKKIIFYSP